MFSLHHARSAISRSRTDLLYQQCLLLMLSPGLITARLKTKLKIFSSARQRMALDVLCSDVCMYSARQIRTTGCISIPISLAISRLLWMNSIHMAARPSSSSGLAPVKHISCLLSCRINMIRTRQLKPMPMS